jgi:UDPglucose 6-dehydrogenase
MQPSIAIVGYGDVGRSVHRLFPEAVCYDEPLGLGTRDEVNRCRFAFVAVPTPQGAGGECDVSIVEDVVGWLKSDYIVILSTIAPGTTERLVRETGKHIVFQPAYGPGETPEHPFGEIRNQRWLILGGERAHTIPVADLYKTVFNAETSVWQTNARTAELTKYMENAYLALKVTFCNEFYDIASVMGVDYNELRELWLLDPRIGRSHTFVFPDNRGYGGKCLPKDVSALIQSATGHGYVPGLLAAMAETNARFRLSDSETTDLQQELSLGREPA